MPNARKKTGYSKKDLREVSDNPELTRADFAKARPFSEVFPDLSASIRKGRGPNKSPTKKLVSLRLSQEVIAHFKSTGPGWQSRIDAMLRKAVRIKASWPEAGRDASGNFTSSPGYRKPIFAPETLMADSLQ